MIVTAIVWGFMGNIPLTSTAPGILLHRGGLRSISSLTSGKIVELLLHEGDNVEQGQIVARLQPLSQYPETASVDVTSPYNGRISRLNVHTGTVVQTGDLIASVGSTDQELEAVLFMATDQGKKVRVGQSTQITVSTVDRQEFGFIYGSVRSVAHYSVTEQQMLEILGSSNLVKVFQSSPTEPGPYQAAPIEIHVRLFTSLDTASGLQWSSKDGPPFKLSSGTICQAQIVTMKEHPVDLVVPYLLKRFGAPAQ
jgi:multidrug resistance efflux pump